MSISEMTNEELEAALQAADTERMAAREKAKEISAEVNRRGEEERLAKIAQTLTPEEAARVAELSQSIQAEGIASQEAVGEPGAAEETE